MMEDRDNDCIQSQSCFSIFFYVVAINANQSTSFCRNKTSIYFYKREKLEGLILFEWRLLFLTDVTQYVENLFFVVLPKQLY